MTEYPCPVCGMAGLRAHCDPRTNRTCTWDARINPKCRAYTDRLNPKRHSHPILSHCITCGPITHSRRTQ